VYAHPNEEAADVTVVQVGPPPEDARILYELARRGRIVDIQARLDDLARRGPEYGAIVANLRQLARRYRSREIRAILEPYLMEGAQ
jgi:hypothetical protein